MRFVITVVCSLITSLAHAETPPATPAPGLWLYAALGYPTFGGLGLGYRFASGTEIMANVGALPLLLVWGLTGELAANQEVGHAGPIALHVGIHAAADVVTGAPDGGLGSSQLWIGPRLGIKMRMPDGGFIDLDVGPSFIRGNYADRYVPRSNELGISGVVRFRI